jgi:hypothetical protein
MPAPIIGESSPYKIVGSLRELWALAQSLPADLAAAEADIAALQAAVAALQATRPAFSAHKNGTDQTGIVDATITALTFGTEAYDRGGFFASNVWTPPAGLVVLKAGVIATGTLDTTNPSGLIITKNGATFKLQNNAQAAGVFGGALACSDIANGSDVYGVSVSINTAAGTATATGAAANTWFMGEWLQA